MTQMEVSLSSHRNQCGFENKGVRCRDVVVPPGPDMILIFCARHQREPRFIAVPVRVSPAEGISALTHAAFLRSMGYPAVDWEGTNVIIGPTDAPTLNFYSDKRPIYEAHSREEAIILLVAGEQSFISHLIGMGRKGKQ